MSTNISFNSNSLQTDNIITDTIEHHQWPQFDANTSAIAHANRSKVVYGSFPAKSIVVAGRIVDTGVVALDTLLDTFKSYFLGFDKNLDIDYNGTTRRYVAYANKVSVDRPNGLAYGIFEVEFIATEPFGRDTTTTTALTATGRTSASYSDAYTFLGTAPYQLPTFTVTYSALTGGTDKTVTLGNLTTGQAITITRTWSNGDVLVVDTANKIVTVNGTEVAFTGAFPEFVPGSRTITYADTLTTRTFDISVVYYKRYL